MATSRTPQNRTEHVLRDAAGPRWRKSTRSVPGGECVETASLPGGIGIRDSKDAGGPVITVPSTGWQDLVRQIKKGEHDLP
ncbi:DUF397 domain-containing protein [Actinomadura fibrosa]|uniref:DUF397 domain-containing protein n=1 Tax=Actinomadura fibrosa TaxID=111802 RepID=A0ABW2XQI4_9ACTN|nr:DUF397 domain-containing protein [Actinomadura fibrosa]